MENPIPPAAVDAHIFTKEEKRAIGGVIAYNLIFFLFSALWIFTNFCSGWKAGLGKLTDLNINEGVTYAIFFSGVLGGSFYCLRSVYLLFAGNFPGNTQSQQYFNIRVWWFWYLFRPLQSGVLALIVLCLVNSNLLTLKDVTAESLKSFYSLIAVGFLVGLGTHEVIQKVQELIAVLFSRSKAGDKTNLPK